jgi:hypothetical protein
MFSWSHEGGLQGGGGGSREIPNPEHVQFNTNFTLNMKLYVSIIYR